MDEQQKPQEQPKEEVICLSPSLIAGKPPLASIGRCLTNFNLSGVKHYYGGRSKSCDAQESPLLYNLLHFEKYPSNRPVVETAWSGCFEIHDTVSPNKFYGGFEAHRSQLPCFINGKVHQFTKLMPKVLQFELLPRRNIWAEIFNGDFAFSHDISIYFFPGSPQRTIEQYVYLWWFIGNEDLVMKSHFDGMELLIFSSKRLRYAEELNWIPFLWGVFRVAKEKHMPTSIDTTNGISEARISELWTTVKKRSPRMKIKRLQDLEIPLMCSRKEATTERHLLMGETRRLNDLEVPPKYSRKEATIKQHSSVEKTKWLNDLEFPPGCSRKEATMEKLSLMEETKRLNDLEVPPGCSRKEATMEQLLLMGETKRLNDLDVPPGCSRKEVTTEQLSLMEETKRLNDLEVPPGFSRKEATIEQHPLIEETKRLNDLEIPCGFSKKGEGIAAPEAIWDDFSGLVDVPLTSDAAYDRVSAYMYQHACQSQITSFKRSRN